MCEPIEFRHRVEFNKNIEPNCYLLNNSYQAIGSFNLRDNKRNVRDPEGGDKLLRNDGTSFTDEGVASSERVRVCGKLISLIRCSVFK